VSVVRDAASRVRAYLEAHDHVFPGLDMVAGCANRDDRIIDLSARDLAALVEFADAALSRQGSAQTSQNPGDTSPDQPAIDEVHFALPGAEATPCRPAKEGLITSDDRRLITCLDCRKEIFP